ncbi:Trypanosomal VSG domain containing protein, putative [Trypanosoma equiperdum]|uniref:Trypanosomal VSG domain containing protein, putative n=1 Tax=Trypanosoma equiperdum TaxID=5694 RepID=A0A1G4I0H9_TRYEQ|nr:Trypanosomal VSG domain containing protein, putative [Trypanosoma equiperdum]
MEKVVYGGGPAATDFTQSKRVTGGRAVVGNCKLGGKIDDYEALGDAFLCVCVNAAGSAPTGDKKICSADDGDFVAKQFPLSAANAIKEAWGELKGKCKLQASYTTTAAGIRQAVAAVQAHIKKF